MEKGSHTGTIAAAAITAIGGIIVALITTAVFRADNRGRNHGEDEVSRRLKHWRPKPCRRKAIKVGFLQLAVGTESDNVGNQSSFRSDFCLPDLDRLPVRHLGSADGRERIRFGNGGRDEQGAAGGASKTARGGRPIFARKRGRPGCARVPRQTHRRSKQIDRKVAGRPWNASSRAGARDKGPEQTALAVNWRESKYSLLNRVCMRRLREVGRWKRAVTRGTIAAAAAMTAIGGIVVALITTAVFRADDRGRNAPSDDRPAGENRLAD